MRWFLACSTMLLVTGCGTPSGPGTGSTQPSHEGEYGIYRFEPSSGEISLVYSSDNPLRKVMPNGPGTVLVFREDFGDDEFSDSEICTIGIDGTGYTRLTTNTWLDVYPCWSPDDSQILYLSWPDYPDNTLDIFLMDHDGLNQHEFYDSGYHDGDCCWVGSKIVFTRQSQIWIMESDGTGAQQVTDFELAGQQGSADLPFGDYDPRLNPQGTLVCFDRLHDDQVPYGNYDFFTILPDGSGETQITYTAYSQFMAEWSHAGDRLLYTVGAIDGQGVFDTYVMNSDGTGSTCLTPTDWPPEFICAYPVFLPGDQEILFIGQWWGD